MPPASRWATPPGIRSGRRRSFARCSPDNGATACFRTSCSPTALVTSPVPSSGRPSGHPMLRSRRRPRDRPAPDPRDGRVAGVPPGDRPSAGALFLEELLPKLAAWHAYLYRERCAKRRRSRRDLASVGIGDGQLAALGRALSSGSRSTPDAAPGVRTRGRRARRRHPSGHPTRSTTATCTSSTCSASSRTTPHASEPSCHSRSSPFSSTRCSSSRTGISPRSHASSAPIRRPSRAGPRALPTLSRSPLGRGARCLRRLRRREGARVDARTAAGLAPLYAGVPTPARAAQMVEVLAGSRVAVGEAGWAITSLAPRDPGFQPARYWRGPIWPILNWVLQRGLDRYGYPTARRRCSPRDHRAGAKRRLLRALQPRDGSRAGWRGVRLDGGARSRSPNETGRRAGGAIH